MFKRGCPDKSQPPAAFLNADRTRRSGGTCDMVINSHIWKSYPGACPGFLKVGGPISLGSLKKRSSDLRFSHARSDKQEMLMRNITMSY